MSKRDAPRSLADREREQSRCSLARERSQLVSQREWDSFLEAFYRALMILAHWIERQRK